MPIPVIRVKGSYYDMGVAQGKVAKDKIHALAAERLRLSLQEMEIAGLHPDEAVCLTYARAMLKAQEDWNTAVHEEFMGIAEGANIEPERLLIANGYTDFKDVVVKQPLADVMECTSLYVLPEASATGRPYSAQTWDMHKSAEEFVVIVERHPDEGPRTLALTTAGCLSLMGVNEWGLTIGTNNLTPDDSVPGVHYLALIHAALQSSNFDEAVFVITDAPRASGHHYYLVDADGGAVGIETSATDYRMIRDNKGIYGYANHYLDASLTPSKAPLANTVARQQTVTRLLEDQRGRLDADTIKQILQDRSEQPNCICRYGEEPLTGADPRRALSRTCAAAVLDPVARGFWAVWGPPDQGTWEWHVISGQR